MKLLLYGLNTISLGLLVRILTASQHYGHGAACLDNSTKHGV